MAKKISGVYKITNNITSDFYIGSSKNINERWKNHKKPSQWKQRPNSKLYQNMAQYGLVNFKFEIIEETDNLKEREQYYIDKLKPSYNNIRVIGLNIERWKEYRQSEKGKDINRRDSKKYYSQLVSYEGEIITLNALRLRFKKIGIPHATLEAKKYLIRE